MDFVTWHLAWTLTSARFQESRRRDAGEVSLTTVILAFVLAGLAITVGAIIVGKVTAKANSIPTE